MLTKSQRLTNLKQLRQNISVLLKEQMSEHQLSINELSQVIGWSPLFLQAIIDNRANLNIGDINYLASLFDRRVTIAFEA